jgi:hypothetical protein
MQFVDWYNGITSGWWSEIEVRLFYPNMYKSTYYFTVYERVVINLFGGNVRHNRLKTYFLEVLVQIQQRVMATKAKQKKNAVSKKKIKNSKKIALGSKKKLILKRVQLHKNNFLGNGLNPIDSTVGNLVEKLRLGFFSRKKNHWGFLVNCSTFLEAFAYAKVEKLSPSLYGILLQNLITIKHPGWKTLKHGALEGDLTTSNHLHLEVKVSFGGLKVSSRNVVFGFKNIRLACICDFFILIAYHVTKQNYSSLGALFVFKMTQRELFPFLPEQVSSSSIKPREHVELSVTFGSVRWKAMLQYRITLDMLSAL